VQYSSPSATEYCGPNKLAFEGIRGLDDAAFKQALTYSLVDAGVQLGLFVPLASYLYSALGVRVVPMFATYVRAADMHLAYAAICAFVPLACIGFFLEHNGIDTSLRFAWLHGGANATVPA
jgi:hypothetical protein